MTREESEKLAVHEIALTGFQLLLRAGITESILNGSDGFSEEELNQAMGFLCLKETEELLSNMKKNVSTEYEKFVTKEDTEERHPALIFLDRVLAEVADRSIKYEK